MSLASWFQPSHRTLAAFLCLMLILGGALGWLGWRLLAQERALEKQRVQERVEQAADRIASVLQRGLSDLEGYLNFLPGPDAKDLPPCVAVVIQDGVAFAVYPPNRLLFYPVIPRSNEPQEAIFKEGEALEFQNNDPEKAAEVFRELARRSSIAEVRAGALLRLGRNLYKSGRGEEALRVYGDLARLGPVSVAGLPAELWGYEARATVFETMGKQEELHREASAMWAALQSGRWRLSRDVWEYRAEEIRQWLGNDPMAESGMDGLPLSIAAEWLHTRWNTGAGSDARQLLEIEAKPVLVSWKTAAGRSIAVLAGPSACLSLWQQAVRGENVQSALANSEGKILLGSFDNNAWQAVRTAAGLPWILHVTSADPAADSAGLAGRRRLLLWGFAVLALVLVAGAFFILRSIERERAVAQLQSEFVSAVSHEFRTPLTSLRQLSEMLAKGRVPTEKTRQQSYDILARESERLQHLVESLLDFGRIEARAFRYQQESLDPATLVDGVVTEFQQKVTDKGYHVELTRSGDCPKICGDPQALGLALRNLLDNAVRYSPDYRIVKVEMGCEKNRLAIRVRDRGLGIPAAEQKNIFKKFVRGSGARNARIPGTGIGLAMARNIVAAHGGEIRLDSESGRGSTFTILLPLEKAS
jgi:signal transduction histidine kinase